MYIDHRYEVLESLGTGPSANTYKVLDVRTGNLHTLKLFQFLSSADIYQNFKARDMHHITKIEHPNLSHVVDFGHVSDHIYFVSDYFEGATLNSFRFTKNRVKALLDIIVQVCYALNALHTQNILHRDLKPENILYKASGNTMQVKLIDYGFSRLELDKDQQYVSGTLPYIAPEIYLGKPAGPYSDFYSLGVVIYRILTGSFPFNMEQITALRSGSQKYFIPIFPSELNPQIPLFLEKLCLRLLERNPENRFQNSAEIITYINRSAEKEYPFSVSWSLVNSLQFNSYTVREQIADELLKYLPLVEEGNGKIISLVGGEGMGKDNILSLFRYHILRGAYSIFDYTCTRSEHEAFFALIKEYLQSLSPEEMTNEQSVTGISEKMRRYLFTSEQAAKGITQSQADLKADFEFARTLLIQLSQRKPLIFIIRNIQHVHHHTIDFINFISREVVGNRILILLSSTDFNKIKQIEHTVLIHVPMYELGESVQYIRKLMNAEVPESFCRLVHQRSSGNPFFIREILIDLTLRQFISFDGVFKYPANLDDYALPSRIIHSIYSRMSHLTDNNYRHLQKLSIVQTPLTLDLIRLVCKIQDNELFNLLNESKYNEILDKRDNSFYFTFPEARDRFFGECQPKLHKLVSLRVLKFYADKQVQSPEIYRGLIKNARIADDPLSERRQLLNLYHLLDEDYEQEQALDAIGRVLLFDLQPELQTPLSELKADLLRYQEKVELTGLYAQAGLIWENQARIPECFEKYLVLGSLKYLADDQKNALKYFLKADKLAPQGQAQAACKLYLAQCYASADLDKMGQSLEQAEGNNLPLGLRIGLLDLQAWRHGLSGDYDRAIQILETMLAELPINLGADILIRLASAYSRLGELYSAQKNITGAEENFHQALGIWKRYNVKRQLGMIYNHLADLHLKQGQTITAVHEAQTGLHYSRDLGLILQQALALLIQGEAKIKMGEFLEAEAILEESRELLKMIRNTKYLQVIQRNLALAKSKIIGFGYYHSFIVQNEPKLIDGQIAEINPLVKTYFYYLSEMANPRKLRRLISKNAQIDYQAIQEQEFYHNVLSLLAISEQNYETALKELYQAMQFAGEINNHYALAVFNILLAICHYGLGDYIRAAEVIEQARPAIEENQYRYWIHQLEILNLKLELTNPAIPLRKVLRGINTQMEVCGQFQYYQLLVELRQMKIQVLLEMGVEEAAAAEYRIYQSYLEKITADISDDDRQNYLKICQYQLKDLKKFRLVSIASRRKDTRSKWNDLLYNIVNVNSVPRVKFLVEKGVTQVLAPWRFKLMVYSDKIGNFYDFVCYNCDPEMLLPPEFTPQIDRSFETDGLVSFLYKERHTLIAPLQSGSKKVGFLILSDDGELDFTSSELALIRNIKSHLTALIIRTWDYMEITVRMEKMSQLMQISHDLIRIVDTAELETAMVAAAIDFTNATRGFLIKKDSDGNNLYQVQMNQDKKMQTPTSGISTTAIGRASASLKPVLTYNAAEDESFRKSISVQDYAIHTIFCCPIMVDGQPSSYLYLDNYGDSTREMYLNEEVIELLLNQVAVALRNARQYDQLVQKSTELKALELMKDEFMAIINHELNTPLSSLQGYMSLLRRKLYADEEDREALIAKMDTAVARLTMSINDISTMNTYNITKTLVKKPISIGDLLFMVLQEVEISARDRHLQFKTEVEDGLPQVNANWKALHRMIYNIMLNAVRFTNEFGSIVAGARRSIYPQEKIGNRDTLVIYVRDNGIGIPEYQQRDIFRKFFELNEIYAHKSGTTEYRSSGLGLGLAMAKRIAELHGGDIVVKSKENEGTTVSMLIPFK